MKRRHSWGRDLPDGSGFWIAHSDKPPSPEVLDAMEDIVEVARRLADTAHRRQFDGRDTAERIRRIRQRARDAARKRGGKRASE